VTSGWSQKVLNFNLRVIENRVSSKHLFYLLTAALFFSSLSLLYFSFSSLLFFFLLSVFPLSFALSLCLPCIYRQKQGRDMDGAATVQPPLYHPRDNYPPFSPTRGKLWANGVGRRLFEREMVVENRGRKIFFFPYFVCPGGEKDPQCRSKRHRFRLLHFFFNEQSMKQRRLSQNAPFHLNENNAKLMSKSKSVFNL